MCHIHSQLYQCSRYHIFGVGRLIDRFNRRFWITEGRRLVTVAADTAAANNGCDVLWCLIWRGTCMQLVEWLLVSSRTGASQVSYTTIRNRWQPDNSPFPCHMFGAGVAELNTNREHVLMTGRWLMVKNSATGHDLSWSIRATQIFATPFCFVRLQLSWNIRLVECAKLVQVFNNWSFWE